MLYSYFLTSIRSFLKNRTYFSLSIASLTLGISCVIALFTLISNQSRYDKHHQKFDRIHRVIGNYQVGDLSGKTSTVPHPFAESIKPEIPGIEAISNIFMLEEQVTLISENNKKLRQGGIAFVQPDIFRILTWRWLAGLPDLEDKNAVYISASTASKYFGNTDLQMHLGKTINLANKHNLTIKGVYEDFPKTTDFPFKFVLGYELQEGVNPYFSEGKLWERLNGGTQCLLLVKEEVDVRIVQRDISITFEKYNVLDGYNLELQPMRSIHSEDVSNYSGMSFQPSYKIISYAMAVLLAIIGSINFINLTTARAINRIKEVGIRKVLGGRRIDLVFQLLLETSLMVFVSIILGLFLAGQMLTLFSSLLRSEVSILEISWLEWTYAGFVILTVMTLLSGLYPAWMLSRYSALVAMKTRSSNADRQSKFPIRKVLVGVQFAFSTALIIGAIVIFTQMNFLRNYDMGFRSDGVVQFLFPEPDLQRQNQLKNALEAFPEIESVSIHLGSPVANTNNTGRFFNPEQGADYKQRVNVKSIDEEYLQLFGIDLISGRNLTSQDPKENILVTKETLSTFNLGSPEIAVGQILSTESNMRYNIIGVVEDFNSFSLKRDNLPVIMNYNPAQFFEMAVKVSPGVNPQKAVEKIEASWENIFPELLIDYNYLSEHLTKMYQAEEVMSKAISFLVFIAIIISVLGLYGLTNYMANTKRKEIGIRKAIGASVPQILRLFFREVIWLILVSYIIGALAMRLLMSLWLETFEHRIGVDWMILSEGFAVTVLIALASMGYRSLIAARTNPAQVLAEE